LKALSIRQPYAWLVVAGLKSIENRGWNTRHRGQLLIHAARNMHEKLLIDIEERHSVRIDIDALKFGGVIGCVEIVDIVTSSPSTWYEGPYGWLLARPRFVPFTPLRGMPGLFDAADIEPAI
jgi:hypothetical protein